MFHRRDVPVERPSGVFLETDSAESSSATMDSLVARTTQLAAELSALQARVSALQAELAGADGERGVFAMGPIAAGVKERQDNTRDVSFGASYSATDATRSRVAEQAAAAPFGAAAAAARRRRAGRPQPGRERERPPR